VAEIGLPGRRIITIARPPFAAVEEVAQQLRAWMAEPAPISAVCCFNDRFAGVSITAARAVGIDVPGQVSVMGIDDEPLGGLLNPTLTTIRYDYTGTGMYVRDRLQHELDGGPAVEPLDAGSIQVVERESTTAPAQRS
jgi:DNA-binding LacI/PurR family transcriptional regulator